MSQLSHDEAVASWVAHLRAGGTTTWSAWRERDHLDVAPAEMPAAPTHDAVHLEVVRRLNEVAGSADPDLADLVLRTGAPGRGMIDVPLPWPGEEPTFGFPAVEPEELPTEELVRLAVGVLAHLLPRVPSTQPAPPPARWPLPWRTRFRLHGSPGSVAGLRRMLLDQGLVESGWRPTHVVVARPVEVMMAEHWAAGVLEGGSLRWSTVWRRAIAAGALPERTDPGRLADRLSGRRHEPVHVVVARDPDRAAALVARVLRARPTPLAPTADGPRTDLLRRVNRLLALTAGPERVRALAGVLVSHVLPEAPGDSSPAPPANARGWAEERAASMADSLRGAGYAVHGDPGELAPTEQPEPGGVDRDRTLTLALAACLRAWQLQGGAR